jgi:radical SAM superfamily enzyme YgiQ (UPF0313 family)
MTEYSVLLVYPPSNWEETELFCQPLGVLTLAAILKEAGIEVQVIDLSAEGWSKDKFRDYFKSKAFTHIGLSVLTPNRNIVYEIFELAKEINPNIICLAGGPHVSYVKEEIFSECSFIDIAVAGEAELKIVEIITKPTEKFYDLGVVQDIDDLPFPDRSFIRHIKYNRFSGMWVEDSASMKWIRGCPWRRCTFCSRSKLTMSHRRRSPAKIVEEIAVIQNELGYKNLFIVDDSLRVNSKHTEEILELKIKEGLDIPFYALARADYVDEESAKLLREANCCGLVLGIESVVPRIIEMYKKTHYDPSTWKDKLENAFLIMNKHNLFAIGTVIVGGPTETKEEVLETVKFLSKSKIDVVQAFAFQYIVGSEFWEEAIKNGKIKPNQYYTYNDKRYGSTTFTTKEIFELTKVMENGINSPLKNPLRYVRIIRKFIATKQWKMLFNNFIRIPILVKNFLLEHPYELVPEDLHA